MRSVWKEVDPTAFQKKDLLQGGRSDGPNARKEKKKLAEPVGLGLMPNRDVLAQSQLRLILKCDD